MRTFAAYGLGLLGARTDKPDVRVAIYDNLVQALWLERVEVQAACLMALGLTPMPVHDEYVTEGSLFEGRTRVDQVLEILSFFDDPEQSFVARSQAPAAISRLLTGAPDSLRGRAAYTFLVAAGPHSKELREVQNAAVIALGQIGRSGGDPVDQQVLDQLERIAYRSSADRSTRFFAMAAFAEAARRRGAGEEPYEAVEKTRKTLLQNLGRSRGETQAWTALALGILEANASERGEVPSPQSGRALRNVIQRTRSHEVAGAIAIALGLLRDREAVEILRDRMLDAGEERVRGYTALALGMIGDPAAVEDVQRVLTDSTMKPFVIENAAIALSLLGDQGVSSQLFEILSNSSRPKVQQSVASALGWIKDPRPIGKLCEQLQNTRKNETGRAWTAVAIGRICDEDRWPWVGQLSINAQYDVWLPTLVEPRLQNGLLDLP
jgi:HEAT repeat protein